MILMHKKTGTIYELHEVGCDTVIVLCYNKTYNEWYTKQITKPYTEKYLEIIGWM